jgi:hypothetical protein
MADDRATAPDSSWLGRGSDAAADTAYAFWVRWPGSLKGSAPSNSMAS